MHSICVFDHKTNKRIAFLENAYNICYTQEHNALWSAQFTLPLGDPKNKYCDFLNFVEIYDGEKYVGLFRIVPATVTKNESTREIVYECEHVLVYRNDGTTKFWLATTTKPRAEHLYGGTVGIEFGGTGASNAEAARENLDAQQTLLAGNNIQITGNTISAKDGDVGDLKDSFGTPSPDWVKCDGRSILEKDYPALVPLMGQYAKRWYSTGTFSGIQYIHGKLLALSGKDLWEYDETEQDWIVHKDVVSDSGQYLLCANYYDDKWQLAVGWLTMSVYEAATLDGPWTKHGSYGGMSTVYPIKVQPDDAGGFVFAGYNFSCFLGVGHVHSDYACTITMLDEVNKYDDGVTLVNMMDTWLITAHRKSDNAIWLYDASSPNGEWSGRRVAVTEYFPRAMVMLEDKFTIIASYDAFYGIVCFASDDFDGTWTKKTVSVARTTPWVSKLLYDGDGKFIGIGSVNVYYNGTYIITRNSNDQWDWKKIAEESCSNLSIAKLGSKVFVTCEKINDHRIARFEDLTKDLTGDAVVPNYTAEHGTTYIKGR